MAKKKKRANSHKGLQVPFRVDDPRLVAALDDYAASIRRSRNMAIVLLLEDALSRIGRWPPGESVDEGGKE
jgi:hypothetical protein